MTSSLLVFNGRWSGFRSVAIPVDDVEVDELGPSPFLWLGLCENFLKKVKLLKVNLWAPSDWKKKTDVKKN